MHELKKKTIKGRDIYVPFEYVKYAHQARANPCSYEAKYLKYDFYKDFGTISYYDSICPGNNLQELKAVIPSDYHYFYDQLPHLNKSTKQNLIINSYNKKIYSVQNCFVL